MVLIFILTLLILCPVYTYGGLGLFGGFTWTILRGVPNFCCYRPRVSYQYPPTRLFRGILPCPSTEVLGISPYPLTPNPPTVVAHWCVVSCALRTLSDFSLGNCHCHIGTKMWELDFLWFIFGKKWQRCIACHLILPL